MSMRLLVALSSLTIYSCGYSPASSQLTETEMSSSTEETSTDKQTLLITGFHDFTIKNSDGSVREVYNSTGPMVSDAEWQHSMRERFGDRYDITFDTLDVKKEAYDKNHKGIKYDRVINLGVSGGLSNSVRIDPLATNETTSTADLENCPNGVCISKYPSSQRFHSKWELPENLWGSQGGDYKINRGQGSSVGGFVCNDTYCRSLEATGGNALFVHTPIVDKSNQAQFNQNMLGVFEQILR